LKLTLELRERRPVVEINLMGYADPNQTGTGLRQRLYSRAFIIGDSEIPDERFVYLVLDTQSGDTAVRHGILEALQNLGLEYAIYGQHNVAVTGTHSHSGPGAWLNYLLPQITSKGFDRQSYAAIVQGAVLSIRRAHESLAPGRLMAGSKRIEDANINRSLFAYLANPKEERARYQDNVDKDLTLLRLTRSSDGQDIGILSWFPTHGTSMLGNNTLITGDNKGVAAYLFEKAVRDGENRNDFVAGFSQANVGDTSPNVLGAYCEDGTGEECRLEDSTCGGRNEPCHGRGPFYGLNDGGTKSCFEIGRRQFEGAKALYDAMVSGKAGDAIGGRNVRAVHKFVDLAGYTFPHPNGTMVSTCPAALGYSFAAGTSDGPGKFDFKQNNPGDPNANPLWKVVRNFIHDPSEKQTQCQGVKPILLDVGETHKPYAWSPDIVDVQILRAGQLIIIVSPGEASTMSGRRWKEAVHDSALQMGLFSDSSSESTSEPIVVLGGPANSYTHYITTEEEYAIQRYEGASTLYGPHTLNAYINLTLSHLHYLSAQSKKQPKLGPSPPVNTNRSLSFINGVVVDRPGFFKSFGEVTMDVYSVYKRGDVAVAEFVGANPRNNLRLEGTFGAVEQLAEESGLETEGEELRARNGAWKPVRSDEDWDLVYEWRRESEILGTSNVKVSWEIGGDVPAGKYRLRYYGDAKSLGGSIEAFEGTSGVFEVL
jgi:neutral ceramidase